MCACPEEACAWAARDVLVSCTSMRLGGEGCARVLKKHAPERRGMCSCPEEACAWAARDVR
eukprot:1203413-Prymnesium_polylepis.1